MVGKALWPSWRRKCLIKNSHISYYISITKAFIANQSCFWLLAGRLLLGKMIIFRNLRPAFSIRWQSKNSPLSKFYFTNSYLSGWVGVVLDITAWWCEWWMIALGGCWWNWWWTEGINCGGLEDGPAPTPPVLLSGWSLGKSSEVSSPTPKKFKIFWHAYQENK